MWQVLNVLVASLNYIINASFRKARWTHWELASYACWWKKDQCPSVRCICSLKSLKLRQRSPLSFTELVYSCIWQANRGPRPRLTALRRHRELSHLSPVDPDPVLGAHAWRSRPQEQLPAGTQQPNWHSGGSGDLGRVSADSHHCTAANFNTWTSSNDLVYFHKVVLLHWSLNLGNRFKKKSFFIVQHTIFFCFRLEESLRILETL